MDDQWIRVRARAETTVSMDNHSAGGWYEDASRRQVLPGASSTSASRIPGAASPGPHGGEGRALGAEGGVGGRGELAGIGRGDAGQLGEEPVDVLARVEERFYGATAQGRKQVR
jgi:hypothetical protein